MYCAKKRIKNEPVPNKLTVHRPTRKFCETACVCVCERESVNDWSGSTVIGDHMLVDGPVSTISVTVGFVCLVYTRVYPKVPDWVDN